jgi:hypothetical protein
VVVAGERIPAIRKGTPMKLRLKEITDHLLQTHLYRDVVFESGHQFNFAITEKSMFIEFGHHDGVKFQCDFIVEVTLMGTPTVFRFIQIMNPFTNSIVYQGRLCGDVEFSRDAMIKSIKSWAGEDAIVS